MHSDAMRFEVMPQTEKEKIRKEILFKTRTFDETYLRVAQSAFFQKLVEMNEFQSARSIFIYLSINKEPDTRSIVSYALAQNKLVYVPKCTGKGTMVAVRVDAGTVYRMNSMQIPEPVAGSETGTASEMDLCVIPCVAASPDGRRLGHGGGYYDRFLAGSDTFKLCLCYEPNLSACIPTEKHDVLMDTILTEKRLIVCK